MLFNGGLVPTYILITKYLHLSDSIWVYIIPALVNPWNMFLLRNFFNDIPEALKESALLRERTNGLSCFASSTTVSSCTCYDRSFLRTQLLECLDGIHALH